MLISLANFVCEPNMLARNLTNVVQVLLRYRNMGSCSAAFMLCVHLVAGQWYFGKLTLHIHSSVDNPILHLYGP